MTTEPNNWCCRHDRRTLPRRRPDADPRRFPHRRRGPAIGLARCATSSPAARRAESSASGGAPALPLRQVRRRRRALRIGLVDRGCGASSEPPARRPSAPPDSDQRAPRAQATRSRLAGRGRLHRRAWPRRRCLAGGARREDDERWESLGARVEIRGHQLFVVDLPAERESAPPVLILHGFPTSSMDWSEVVPALRRARRVVAFDLLGFGSRTSPTSPTRCSSRPTSPRPSQRAGLSRVALLTHDVGDRSAASCWRARKARLRGGPASSRTAASTWTSSVSRPASSAC
jgi:hypothetical protein